MPKTLSSARNALLFTLLTAVFLAGGSSVGIAAASVRTDHPGRHSQKRHSQKRHPQKRHSQKRHPRKPYSENRLVTLEGMQFRWGLMPRKHRARQHPARRTPNNQHPAKRHPAKQQPAKSSAPTATAAQAGSAEPVGIPGNWNLILDSEFNGSSLNTSLWHTGWYGNGVTGPVNSLETACYSPNNITFPGDGSMHLNLTATSSTCNGQTEPYTGALVSTNPNDGGGGFQYTYGVLEARVYIPGDGTQIANWPQVWADGQNWPQDGEDDLMRRPRRPSLLPLP